MCMRRFKVLFESSILTEMSEKEYDGGINHVDGAANQSSRKALGPFWDNNRHGRPTAYIVAQGRRI